MNEAAIEQEIQDKNLNAPRLTPEIIDRMCEKRAYHVFEGTTSTVCCITLPNGTTVIGESACVSPANFDEEIGRKIAFEDARRKVWPLAGYELKERLFRKGAF